MKLGGLCAVTLDDPLLPRLSALVKAALDGGTPFVQYRNKMASRALRRAQAAEMLRICRAVGAKLIINDDVWLAVEIGADGAHLGRDDAPGGSLAAARDAGLQLMVLIYQTPKWASDRAFWDDPPSPAQDKGVYQPYYPVAKAALDDWQLFSRHVAQSFRGLVSYYECWCEPNLWAYIYPQSTAAEVLAGL